MFIKFLEKLSVIKLELNRPVRVNANFSIVNTAIFKKDFYQSYDCNLDKYKIAFFLELGTKEIKILKIKLDVEIKYEKWKISNEERDILYSEINAKLTAIQFLKETYNIEAKKLNPEYSYKEKEIDYKHYNKVLFWISNINHSSSFKLPENCSDFPDIITKSQLKDLIKYSKSIEKNIKFKFWRFPNFSFDWKHIKITEKEKYNVQNIISIFFHETTHFYRHFNGLRNFGFNYSFVDYHTLEEWISLYNEYVYWNKITNYWKYIPYYNYCINILKQDIPEDEKKEQIYKILHCKGYNKVKSNSYYYRFNRYSKLSSKDFYLKDLIYSNAYKNVTQLLKKDSKNYEIIMSGRIWLNEITSKFYVTNKNADASKYFEKMSAKIIQLISTLYE